MILPPLVFPGVTFFIVMLSVVELSGDMLNVVAPITVAKSFVVQVLTRKADH